jgi:sortase (surface protein transpeptidase)
MEKQQRRYSDPSQKRRRNTLSTCFLIIGSILLFSVALSMIKIDLSTHQSSHQHYLISSSHASLSLPEPQSTSTLPSKQPEPIEISQPTPLPRMELTAIPTLSPESEKTAEPTLPTLQISPVEPSPQPFQPSGTATALPEPKSNPSKAISEPGIALMPDQQFEMTPEPVASSASETSAMSQWGHNLAGPTTVYFPIVNRSGPDGSNGTPSGENTAENPLAGPPPGAVPGPSAGAVVRLVIPNLKIDRAVVMVGLKTGSGNQVTWNTDSLFSNANRQDLVGQTITSANPGEGGNIILIGHNYNNGWNANGAVFVNLLSLKPGSVITLYTESGKEFRYIVQLVKKVPWNDQDDNELQKHHKYMWPTDHEQLTLVTCGGTYLGTWPARIYAIALPAES